MTGASNRRALLRTGALALGSLAGCVGLGNDTPQDETPNSTTSETVPSTTSETTGTTETSGKQDETAKESDIAISPRSVQSSFFYLTTPDSMDVGTVEGEQFLFVTVAGTDDWPRPGAIEFVADGERFRPTTTPGPIADPYRLYEQNHVYDPDGERAGWLAFEVPDPLEAESVALAYDDRRWSLAEEYRNALARPPAEFELLSFDVPDRVTSDETFDVSFAVENTGESDGTFRACLNESGPSYVPHTAELSVPAGECAEWSQRFGSRISASTESAIYRFRSAVADRDRSVEVVSETTSE